MGFPCFFQFPFFDRIPYNNGKVANGFQVLPQYIPLARRLFQGSNRTRASVKGGFCFPCGFNDKKRYHSNEKKRKEVET